VEFYFYDGNIEAKTLVDWIGDIERYFEYENLPDPDRVCFEIMKLKGNSSLWWDVMHKDIVDKQ
jgi:hypothetical protein